MKRTDYLIAGLLAAFLTAVPPARAQSAPRVRLATLPATGLGTVEASISLTEPAYIFAVAIDRGGQIKVLSPSVPSDAIRFEAAKSIRFPGFFKGFSNVSNYGEYGSRSTLAAYGDDRAAYGSVLVVASRTPFDFSRISDGVYWNEQAVREIVRYRSPAQAVTAVGRAITLKGESFGHDYVYFGNAGYSQFAGAAFNTSSNCVADYSYSPYGYSSFKGLYGVSGAALDRLIISGNRTVTLIQVGTDGCGRPHYILMPVQTVPLPDSVAADTATKAAFRAVAAGVYTGEAAQRVFEDLQRRNSSDTFVGLSSSAVFEEKGNGRIAHPVTLEAAMDRVESTERMRDAANDLVNRMPVLRADPAPEPLAAPVTRAEPVPAELRAPSAVGVQRQSKPTEGVTPVKDN